MSVKKLKKLRIEFEFSTTKEYKITEDIIKEKFQSMLKELIKMKLVDMDYTAEMTMIDISPIEWIL